VPAAATADWTLVTAVEAAADSWPEAASEARALARAWLATAGLWPLMAITDWIAASM
jgi:hypothetical protein